MTEPPGSGGAGGSSPRVGNPGGSPERPTPSQQPRPAPESPPAKPTAQKPPPPKPPPPKPPPPKPPPKPPAPALAQPTAVLDEAHLGDIEGALGRIRVDEEHHSGWRRRLVTFLAIVGPGLIVMVGDNDAGGVATYAQAGQNYGY